MKEGQITVFLSLVLILIISLLCGLVDGVRLNVARANMERSLTLALDSVFADYNLPLYKEYGIFLLDLSYGSEFNENKLVEKLEDYINYNFSNTSLVKINLDNLEILNKTFITDYPIEIFTNQSIECMKYKVSLNIFEKFINNISLINKVKETSYKIKDKIIIDEKMQEINNDLIQLIETIEGITLYKGRISSKEYFAKKICNQPITSNNVSIDIPIVFSQLYNKYVNTTNLLNDLEISIKTAVNYDNSIKNLEEKITNLNLEINQILNSEDNKSLSEQKENILENLKKELEETSKKISSQRNQYNNVNELIKTKVNYFNKIIIETKNKTSKAIEIINRITQVDFKTKQLLNNYKMNFNINKDKYFSNSYLDDTSDMSSDILNNINFMLDILKINKNILESEDLKIDIITSQPKTNKNVKKLLEIVLKCKTTIEKYKINTLKFNYENLHLNSTVEDPRENMNSIMKSSIIDMVFDNDESISKKKIKKETLPFNLVEENGKDIKENHNDTILDNLFQSLNLITGLKELEATELFNKLLVNEYIIEHFNGYLEENKDISNKNDINQNKDNSDLPLNYQKEYILSGKDNDYLNLECVLKKILLLRFLFNFVYILSDKEKVEQAKSTSLLLNFSGIVGGVISNIVTIMILASWCYAESLVDLKAIVSGKNLSLIKTKVEWKINYLELFKINKNLIKQKAELISNNESGFNYNDYIKILLLLLPEQEKIYRSLELVEININNKYNKNFKIKNCLYGLNIKIKCEVEPLFIKMMNYNSFNYVYDIEREYIY